MTVHNRLKKLDTRHLAAVRMRIEGATPEEIAQALNVNKRTIYIWFGDPLVKEEIEHQQDEVTRLFQEKMASAGMRAIGALVGLLDKPDEDAAITNSGKIRVAETLLDRLGVTARVTHQAELASAVGGGASGNGGEITNYTAVFANMPNAELAEFIKGWQQGDSGNGHHPVIEQ